MPFPFLCLLLLFFFPSSIYVAASPADFDSLSTNLFGDGSLDSTLLDSEYMLDPLTASSESLLLDDANQGDDSFTAPDPSVSLADNNIWDPGSLLSLNDNPDQSVDPLSSSLLAGDMACDMSQLDETRLFDKVQRGESCKVPSEGGDPMMSSPDHNDEPTGDIHREVLAPYVQENYDVCPEKIFGLSNVPVCKDEAMAKDFVQVGANLFNIAYVWPCTSLNSYPLVDRRTRPHHADLDFSQL